MAELIFWLCLLLPLYAWLGYPLIVRALPQPARVPAEATGAPQAVSVIVAAHNESAHILTKLSVLLDQNYPAESIEILVASDGSTDDTAGLARSLADHRIRVLDLPRVGKCAALNAAARLATHPLLVFTDAENHWSPNTLRCLLAAFDDPQVGAAGGELSMPSDGPGLSGGDGVYRRYEAWLRAAEQRAGCVVSADGAILALRRELFEEIPDGVNDDFFLSTCAPARGLRIAHVPEARVIDRGVAKADRQYRRRLRVTVGGLQSLACRRNLLNPIRHGRYALALISHKVIRRLAPVLLLPLFVSTLFLQGSGWLYQIALLLQLVAYGAGLLGLLDARSRLPRPFRLAGFGLVTLAGMSAGLWQFVRGQRYRLWDPQQNR